MHFSLSHGATAGKTDRIHYPAELLRGQRDTMIEFLNQLETIYHFKIVLYLKLFSVLKLHCSSLLFLVRNEVHFGVLIYLCIFLYPKFLKGLPLKGDSTEILYCTCLSSTTVHFYAHFLQTCLFLTFKYIFISCFCFVFSFSCPCSYTLLIWGVRAQRLRWCKP